MKLGKLPAIVDKRNLKLARLLKVLPTVPDAWDFDLWSTLNISTPMFANDEWGCCVISGRAHQTLRFEAFEQKKVLKIADKEVLAEYWKEGGGDSSTKPDNGLYVLNALKDWRKNGWLASGKRYDIYAFAEIDRTKQAEIKTGMFLLSGLFGGFVLPRSAEIQFNTGQPWSLMPGPYSAPGGWGGHCMYLVGYSHIGPTFVTWGKKQLATWEWFLTYCDELYGVVDNRNRFTKGSPVDINKLDKFLRAVSG